MSGLDDGSWMPLAHESPATRLPEDLRARDPLGGRDCGWVEQMRPFTRHFTDPGDWVLDPFGGFGTTALAAHLEGRCAVIFEIDATRVGMARERLARHGVGEGTARVVHGAVNAVPYPADLPPPRLCLTSVPYFGCRWPGATSNDQLYGSADYARHLDGLADVFHRVRAVLAPDAFCIAFAENLRMGDRMLPLAWDLARLLGSMFVLREERVLVYPRERAPLPPKQWRSNRSHEYALVLQKTRAPADRDRTVACLQAMAAAELPFALHGSFARWWRNPHTVTPADADLLVPWPALEAVCHWLHARGFRLECQGRPLHLPLDADTLRGRWYVRAERIDADGRRVQLDLGYERADGPLLRLEDVQIVRGMPVST